MLIVVKHFEKYRHGKDGAEVAHTRRTYVSVYMYIVVFIMISVSSC